MKPTLKIVRDVWLSNGQLTGLCYPEFNDLDTMNLWWHLFPEDNTKEPDTTGYVERSTSLVEFLARAHNWKIEWMKD